jgi:hypothetical protein
MTNPLKDASTQQLVAELKSREGVQQVEVGLYKGHCIKPRYTKNRAALEFDGIALLIESPANSESSATPA